MLVCNSVKDRKKDQRQGREKDEPKTKQKGGRVRLTPMESGVRINL